ncbi:MAG: 2-oxoacid:acceptor oxidoreductase family protein, partial [Kiritimatiellota bacterium]|nr:2-oxoacid:acceptor oxidoreductase family protein [Kiritimatiellota bacterium]
RIAREFLGVPIVNTTMIGALVRVTGVIRLESVRQPLDKRFSKLAERNYQAMVRAYQETVIEE